MQRLNNKTTLKRLVTYITLANGKTRSVFNGAVARNIDNTIIVSPRIKLWPDVACNVSTRSDLQRESPLRWW